MSQQNVLFVGIGSPHGDDVVGWVVADILRSNVALTHVRFIRSASPLELFDWIDECDRLFLCDGCCGLGSPGKTRRMVWPTLELEQLTWSNTHDFPLTASLQLAERLGRLPPEVILWAIEILPNRAEDSLSPCVASSVPELTERISNELITLRHQASKTVFER